MPVLALILTEIGKILAIFRIAPGICLATPRLYYSALQWKRLVGPPSGAVGALSDSLVFIGRGDGTV